MSDVSETLFNSFRLLWNEPRLFLPKLISTFLSSIWVVGAVSNRLTQVQMLVSLPFILILGVFVSLMVASMVKNRDSENILTEAFREALNSWKVVISTSLFFLITSFLLVIPLSIGLIYFITAGNLYALLAGSSLTLLLMLVLSFYSYFLPITLLEKKSFLSGFRKSVEGSRKSSRSVIGLTMFSFLLLFMAFLSGEYLQSLGYAGFIVGRLLATTVNTYLFVVSPSYYLNQD